jgi:hypothetical protein
VTRCNEFQATVETVVLRAAGRLHVRIKKPVRVVTSRQFRTRNLSSSPDTHYPAAPYRRRATCTRVSKSSDPNGVPPVAAGSSLGGFLTPAHVATSDPP